MKTLAILVTTAAFAHAESAIPTAFNKDRYDETLAASPFVLATPPKEKEDVPEKNFTTGVVLAGLGKLDDGRDYVVCKRAGEDGSMRFEGGVANDEGITVKKVVWAEKLTESTVILKKGTEEGTVKFDENLLKAVVAPPPVQGGGNRPPGMGGQPRGPGQPPQNPTIPQPGSRSIQPPQAGGQPVPRPPTSTYQAPQVPRPGGATAQPQFSGRPRGESGGQSTDPTGGGRTRVRTINNR